MNLEAVLSSVDVLPYLRRLDISWGETGFGNSGNNSRKKSSRTIFLLDPRLPGKRFNVWQWFKPHVTVRHIAFMPYKRMFQRFNNTGIIKRRIIVKCCRAYKDNTRRSAIFWQVYSAQSDKENMISFLPGGDEESISWNNHVANEAAIFCCASSLAARRSAVSSSIPMPVKMRMYGIGMLEPSGSCHSGRCSCV